MNEQASRLMEAHIATMEISLKTAAQGRIAMHMAQDCGLSSIYVGIDLDGLTDWWVSEERRLIEEIQRCRKLLAG